MISPELLRRYPFFSTFSPENLSNIAMITEEIQVANGSTLFEEKQPAGFLYFLIDGGIDLTYKSEEEFHPKTKKVFPVGEVNPGEVFGVSAVIEPYQYNASASANLDSKVLKIDAAGLSQLMQEDADMGYALMRQIAKATMERLTNTRVQLAAAWA
jgi:CRP-like cAMP-binding protein